jgi:phosphonate transport system substrate-binding protein
MAFLAICALFGASLYGADKPITVGLVLDGLAPAERAPLQVYLTRAMGRTVNLVAPDLYSETVARLADGSYDFACLGALMYVRAHAKYGVVPLVQRSSDLQFHTVFITRTDSSIHSLPDLNGKQFAFGDINSASAHLIPYRELKQAGIDPETDLKVRYSGSHVATAALVQSGVADAGALDETIFRSLISSGKLDGNRVRVFYTSKPFVDYVYVAGKDVPEAERQRFAGALLSLQEGKDDAVLKILRAKQFVVAADQEYAPLRQIARQLKMF